MILKSYILEKNKNLLLNYQSILFYGENLGLKKIFKDFLKNKSSEAEIINLYQEDVLKNSSTFTDHLLNNSLFNKNKLIIINEVNDKIIQHTNMILNIDNDIKLVLIAENLEKRSKLRSLFEKDKKLQIVPCYKDNEIALSSFIRQELSEYKGLSQEMINIMINTSNFERDVIINMINKIKIYFDKKILEKKVFTELIDENSTSDNFDRLRDASLLGNKLKLEQLISNSNLISEYNLLYLYKLTARLSKLLDANKLLSKGHNMINATDNLKPPIFWKDKESFIEQMKKWNEEKIRISLKEISELEMKIKKELTGKNDFLIKQILVNLCVKASNPS